MRIRATLSAAEIYEASNLSRRQAFWMRFLGANWYSTVMCAAAVVGIVDALIHGEQPNWFVWAVVFAFGAVFIAASWHRVKRATAKAAADYSARFDFLLLEADSVKLLSAEGRTLSIPWSAYSKWQEGKNVFVLTGPKKMITVLPVDEEMRTSIRNLVQSRIPQ